MNSNTIEFKISGKYALFTDPITKLGGEKCSYHVPTYEALKGITKNIYWKPTFIWFIDKVRVMKKIRTQSKGIKTLNYNDGGNDISIYCYLADVEYQVQAHFEWNLFQTKLISDRNVVKHKEIADRSLTKGGRLPIHLGVSECPADVVPCVFGEGKSYYENDSDELSYGMMFHSFNYPNESNIKSNGTFELQSNWWKPIMKNGIIQFKRPEECLTKNIYTTAIPKYNEIGKTMTSVDGELNELV